MARISVVSLYHCLSIYVIIRSFFQLSYHQLGLPERTYDLGPSSGHILRFWALRATLMPRALASALLSFYGGSGKIFLNFFTLALFPFQGENIVNF